MNIDKSLTKNIIFIFLSIITFIVVIFNLDKVAAFILKGIDMFMPVLIGLGFAFILNPLMNIFEKKLSYMNRHKVKINDKHNFRGISILLSFIVAIGIVLTVFFIAIPQIRNAFVILSRSMPNMIDNLHEWIRNITTKIDISFNPISEYRFNMDNIIKVLSGVLNLEDFKSVNNIFSGAKNIISTFLGSIFNTFVGIAISIHVLINKERIKRFFKSLIIAYMDKNKSEQIFKIAGIINDSFRSFLTGQLTEAVILGVLCFIGMTLFRFPFALAVAAVVALTAMIPILGAWVGGVLGAVLTLSISPTKAIFFIVFIIILQQLENNLIYPRVVGKSMNLPSLLILIAVLVGGSIAGIVGMLLSVPITSVIYTLTKQSIDYRLNLNKEY